MRDAPERIWATCGEYWRYPTFKDDKTEYVRADLSDALLRAAMEALEDARQSLVDSAEEIVELRLTLSKTDLELPWLSDAIDNQTLALAKLRAHLEGEKE